jgi:hypothetical protein
MLSKLSKYPLESAQRGQGVLQKHIHQLSYSYIRQTLQSSSGDD